MSPSNILKVSFHFANGLCKFIGSVNDSIAFGLYWTCFGFWHSLLPIAADEDRASTCAVAKRHYDRLLLLIGGSSAA